MKRILVLIACSILLSGCSDSQAELVEAPMHEGKFLKVAVVGDHVFPEIGNVAYENTTLESLRNQNSEVDVLIVTESAFTEADKDKYVSFFTEVPYAVFFYGINGYNDFAFTIEKITLDMAADEGSAIVQGFKNRYKEDGMSWGFDLPDDRDYTEDQDEELLLKIFQLVD